MITALDNWKFIHILLFVYWLGADLGVFLLALAARRRDLTYDQRAFALKMTLVIDNTPRIAFALMFPAGMELSAAMGAIDEPSAIVRTAAWLISAFWVSTVVGAARYDGQPLGQRLHKAGVALKSALLVTIVGIGLASVLGHGPFPANWLGWKVLLFGFIFACGIMIDREFKPIVPAFARLSKEGSKPDIEQAITGAVNGAIRWVLTLYALVVIIAFLGTARP
jgi:hypothetical protein